MQTVENRGVECKHEIGTCFAWGATQGKRQIKEDGHRMTDARGDGEEAAGKMSFLGVFLCLFMTNCKFNS